MSDVPAVVSGAPGRPLEDIVRAEPARLLAFGRGAILPEGGFGWLDDHRQIDPTQPRFLYLAGRIAHTGALGSLLDLEGAKALANHGIRSLRTAFVDPTGPGWPAALPGPHAPGDTRRSAYATSFVVLAGASGTIAGIHGAEDLLGDSLADGGLPLLGRGRRCVPRGGTARSAGGPGYRGMNSNMHMVEALLAAHSAGAGEVHRERAERIAHRAVQAAAQNDWRLPEHFDARWRPRLDHNRHHHDDPFRPYGSTVGHWFEWSRLLLHLEAATCAAQPHADTTWMRSAALTLFDRGLAEGWNVDGNAGLHLHRGLGWSPRGPPPAALGARRSHRRRLRALHRDR